MIGLPSTDFVNTYTQQNINMVMHTDLCIPSYLFLFYPRNLKVLFNLQQAHKSMFHSFKGVEIKDHELISTVYNVTLTYVSYERLLNAKSKFIFSLPNVSCMERFINNFT